MSAETTHPSLRFPPGPLEWPVIGNPEGVLGARNIVLYAEDKWKTHGDVTRINVFGRRMTLLAHPDHIQRVLLSERQNFVKGVAYDLPRQILGDGLVTLEGSAWRERRTLAQPAFHRQALEKLCALMVTSGANYFENLARRMAGRPLEVEALKEMTHLTLDVVVSALFGRDTLDTNAEVSFEDLGRALELVSGSFNGLPVPKWLPTPHNLKFARVMRSLDSSVYKIIEAGKRGATTEGSLLSMLLAARDQTGEPLPSKALRDEVFTLFLAGHETTALTLTWLLVMLDRRDDVLQHMEDEVDDVLGGRDPDFHDVPKLVYLRQVIDETLRLRPPAPMVARNVVDECEFDGYTVPAGEMVVPFFWGVHRHADFWSAPYCFDPDRFAPEHQKSRSTWCYAPFSAGPRICIGNTFSLIETTVLLAQLLNRFDVKVMSCADVRPLAVGTVRPSRPVRVRLSPRQRQRSKRAPAQLPRTTAQA